MDAISKRCDSELNERLGKVDPEKCEIKDLLKMITETQLYISQVIQTSP